MTLDLSLSTKCPQVPGGCHLWGPSGFVFFSFPWYLWVAVDRGRSVTVEQAFSGTGSSGKYRIFSNFSLEKEKKLKRG